ncbi:MAG: cobalt-precorrin-7 (C(5))-methyltransferase [Methanoregulaceae archaeon]|jgi:cobalt-precorrin-7 (C5)-methyltransferase
MKIVGVGCGPGLLTEVAIQVIKNASIIYGSDRAIELAHPHILPNCLVKTIDDFKSLHKLPNEAVVLSTGDPMLAGLGYLNGEVISGISSLQIAAARLRIPMARIVSIVAHGKGHKQGMHDTIKEIKQKKIVFLLADPKFNVQELFKKLRDLRLPLQIAVCENLGYLEERIEIGSVESPPKVSADLFSLLIGNF